MHMYVSRGGWYHKGLEWRRKHVICQAESREHGPDFVLGLRRCMASPDCQCQPELSRVCIELIFALRTGVALRQTAPLSSQLSMST